MKPTDSTWYYAKVLPTGGVTITSVTLRDTGAQTLAVVGGDRFLARHQKRVTREEVESGDGRASGALGLRSSKRAAVLAAIRRAEASMNLAVEHHRLAARNREALMEELKRHDAPEPSAGLEFHHREPITPGDPPNQLQCHLTGGWCWHDGTSLYAQEHVWPAVEGYLLRGNHEGIFGLLEYELTRHFERLAEDKEAQ